MKIIHQIWIGEEPPDIIKECLHSVESMNPDYDYRLWGNEDLHQFGLKGYLDIGVPETYIANIMRFTILSEIGGWHIDADMMAKSSLNGLPNGEFVCSLVQGGHTFKYEGGGTIYVGESYDFSEFITSYVPESPITPLWNRYLEKVGLEPTEISRDLVGFNGTVLEDVRLNSWQQHKNYGLKLEEIKNGNSSDVTKGTR